MTTTQQLRVPHGDSATSEQTKSNHRSSFSGSWAVQRRSRNTNEAALALRLYSQKLLRIKPRSALSRLAGSQFGPTRIALSPHDSSHRRFSHASFKFPSRRFTPACVTRITLIRPSSRGRMLCRNLDSRFGYTSSRGDQPSSSTAQLPHPTPTRRFQAPQVQAITIKKSDRGALLHCAHSDTTPNANIALACLHLHCWELLSFFIVRQQTTSKCSTCSESSKMFLCRSSNDRHF